MILPEINRFKNQIVPEGKDILVRSSLNDTVTNNGMSATVKHDNMFDYKFRLKWDNTLLILMTGIKESLNVESVLKCLSVLSEKYANTI